MLSDDGDQTVNIASCKAFLAVMFLVGAIAAAAEADFAAIAYSPATGEWGYAHGPQSLATVQNAALDKCNKVDARLAIWVQNGWAALAKAPNGTYGWSWSATSRAEAEAAAKKQAGDGATTVCWVFSGKS